MIFQFIRKLSLTKILFRCLLVAENVLYKSLINITSLSLTLHAVDGQLSAGSKMANYLNDHSIDTRPKKWLHLCQFVAQIPKLGRSETV